jgi:hypothetical protein
MGGHLAHTRDGQGRVTHADRPQLQRHVSDQLPILPAKHAQVVAHLVERAPLIAHPAAEGAFQ